MKNAPGRKKGFRFNRTEDGELLKKDGSIAKKPGRKKKKSTVKAMIQDKERTNLQEKSISVMNKILDEIESKKSLSFKQLEVMQKKVEVAHTIFNTVN